VLNELLLAALYEPRTLWSYWSTTSRSRIRTARRAFECCTCLIGVRAALLIVLADEADGPSCREVGRWLHVSNFD
jgi:hypothetical protein